MPFYDKTTELDSCEYCGEAGHYSEECPELARDKAEEIADEMRQSDPAETSSHGRPGWQG